MESMSPPAAPGKHFEPDIEALLGGTILTELPIRIAEGKASLGRVRNVLLSEAELVARLTQEYRTSETLEQFLALPKAEQDALKNALGFWIAAHCEDGRRRKANLKPRELITLDFDKATPKLFAVLKEGRGPLKGFSYTVHTTRKHTPGRPRCRVVIRLKRAIATDEYERVARLIAYAIDCSMESVDDVSFRPTQMMFWPTCSADSEFFAKHFPGLPVDPDAVLARFRERTGRNPASYLDLPFAASQGQKRQALAKAEDPREKSGPVGAFCRAFPIGEALAEFLPDFYVPGDDDRWTYVGGTTANGVVVYGDGRFLYSHHTSDPLSDTLANSFDAVRLCKFGDLDGEGSEALPIVERPSYKAMVAFVMAIPEVAADLSERDVERVAALVDAFDEEPDVSADLQPASMSHGEVSEARRLADDRAPFGDVWNGATHARRTRDQSLYVSATGQTLAWTGQRWAAQTNEDTMADAKETSARLLEVMSRKVAADPSPDNRRLLTAAGRLHSSKSALQRMVEMSRSEPGMNVASPAEFDHNPYELTVQNGILDLLTGKLRPASPADRVSRLAGVTFDTTAEAPTWEAFLARVQPDPEVRCLLQRAAGMAITGDVGEEKFFLLFGTGANGKSVFCEVLEALMSEFAGSFGAALITKNKHENEAMRMMARLPGLRLALVNETAPGDTFDSTRVKELSSRDRISARFLTKEAFDFAPTHTLIIRTNHLLGSIDAGDGFWRRAVPITFGVQIPLEERITDLASRIVRDELSGVLNWVLAGTIEWKRANRLRLPVVIEAARNEYRTDTDLIGQWFEERTVPDGAAKVPVSACYQDYKVFCEERGAHAGTEMTFSRTMTARGVKRDPSRARGRRFMGFRLEAAEDRFSDESDGRDLIG